MGTAHLVLGCLFFLALASGSLGQSSFGDVTFMTSCTTVQDDVNSAVAVLHSFWYTKARELFQGIAQKDPQCAIAYWGVAMTYWTPLWVLPTPEELAAGLVAVQNAKAVVGGATQREKDYVDAIATFFENTNQYNHTERVLMYEKKMERIYYNYQDIDLEAMVFYPLAILTKCTVIDCKAIGNSMWPTYLPNRRSAKILETVQVYHPYHPGALHYTIHSYDTSDLAHLGLHAANIYASIAPDVPHAVHMPSHIYGRLGMWSNSSVSNKNSMAAAEKWNTHPGVKTSDYTHSLSFGVYAMLQMAEDACVKSTINDAKNWVVAFDGGYELVEFQLLYYLENKDWMGAATVVPNPILGYNWTERYLTYAFPLLFTKGYGFAMLGEKANLTNVINKMDLAYEQLKNSTTLKWSNWIEESNEIQLYQGTLKAFLKWVNGDVTGSLSDFEEMAAWANNKTSIEVPIKVFSELTGEMFLAAGYYTRALDWFEESQKNYPNRFHTLFGLATTHSKLGNVDQAIGYYRDLLSLCNQHTPGCICSNRSQFAVAKAYINSH
eukprot:TRINITY_DN6102_c0_g1_i1.p1 TRINITY_DN6102_c0_g1~~TRINITY_DN6102_c0_g1_i1.p1  ORF type:complete len:550 (+),score=90.12 TRINITY_DN6102_c0_g1_i1:2-1651(+)